MGYTTKQFIEKANRKHNGRYNYSKVEYVNNHTKVKIICSMHGEFEQTPVSHLRGSGCRVCGIDKSIKDRTKTLEQFIKEANKLYDNKYDYSLVEYKNNKAKVKIICPTHGEFEQAPVDHLSGYECKKCGYEKNKDKQRHTKEQFIEKAKLFHGDKYDYSLVEYINVDTKVKIICPVHGVFEQTPYHHSKDNGCPRCKESRGEKEIRDFLLENNIRFESQKKFEDCRGVKQALPFDFYLPEYNLCIEYQGEQHYNKKSMFFSKELIKNDEIKKQYCCDKKISFLEISFKKLVRDELARSLF